MDLLRNPFRKIEFPDSGYLIEEGRRDVRIILPPLREPEAASRAADAPQVQLVDDSLYDLSSKIPALKSVFALDHRGLVENPTHRDYGFTATRQGKSEWILPPSCPVFLAHIIAKCLAYERNNYSPALRDASVMIRIINEKHAERYETDQVSHFHRDSLQQPRGIYILSGPPTTESVELENTNGPKTFMPNKDIYATYPVSSLLPWRLYRCNEATWLHKIPADMMSGNNGERFFHRVHAL